MASGAVQLGETSVGALLDGLAAKSPTPGGGAVAAMTAALGAALGAMVVAYSKGKKKLAEHDALHDEASEQLVRWRRQCLDLARDDEEAYGRLNALWKLDAADPVRASRMPDAVRGAIEVPRRVLSLAEELAQLCERLHGATNAMLASDLAICCILAEAAARAAAWNVRINTPMLDDRGEAERIESETDAVVVRVVAICAKVDAAIRAEGA